MSNHRNVYRVSPLSGIIMVLLFFVLIYLLFKGLTAIASALLPFLAIATLIINYKVYPRYIKFIGDLFQRSIVMGVGLTLLTLMFFPMVILLLFSQALLGKFVENKLKDNPLFDEARRRQAAHSDDDFVEYEEVDDLDLDDSEYVKLPEPEIKPKSKSKDNPYDNFF